MPKKIKHKDSESEFNLDGEVLPNGKVPTETPKEEPVVWPEVASTGKFQMVACVHGDKSGFVVYNPDGARVSEILPDAQAKDIVLRQNVAGHYK